MKTAQLFKNGGSQAVRLPKEFRFDGEYVYIKRMGSAVILLSHENPWETLVDSLEQFSDDFMESRNQPEQEEREELFQ